MIANFFSKTKPVNVFYAILQLFFYYIFSLLFIKIEEITVIEVLKNASFFIWLVLFLLVTNFIIGKNELTQDNLYGLLIMVFLFGTFNETMFNTRIVLSNFTLLLGFRKVYSLRSVTRTKQKLFDAGFWVGISAIIYVWSLLYLLLIYIAIIAYRRISFKNLFVPIIGAIAPILIYFTYNFYFDNLNEFYERFTFYFSIDYLNYNNLKLLIPITLLLTFIIWSTLSVTPKVAFVSNKLKFSWIVLLHHLLLSLIIVLDSPVKNGAEMLFLFFPSAIIIANYIQKSESEIFKNVILYLFLAISIGVYFL